MTLVFALSRGPTAGSRLAFKTSFNVQSRLFLRPASNKAPLPPRPDLATILKRRSAVPKVTPAAATPKVIPLTKTTVLPVTTPAAATQASPVTPTAAIKAPVASPNLTSYAYLRDLSRKTTPTTLYRGPNHFWLFFGSWATGVFCFGYAGYNFFTMYVDPPDGVPGYISYAFAVICVAMGSLGTYYIMRSSNIIREIRVLPLSQVTSLSAGATAAQIAAASKVAELPMEITVKRMLPMWKDQVVHTTTARVTMDGTLSKPEPKYLTEEERAELRRAEEQARREAIQYERDNLTSGPFRHLGRGAKAAWDGIKQALLGSGMVRLTLVNAEGKRAGVFKMDVTNGMALNGGQVLDKLVKVEIEEPTKRLQVYRK